MNKTYSITLVLLLSASLAAVFLGNSRQDLVMATPSCESLLMTRSLRRMMDNQPQATPLLAFFGDSVSVVDEKYPTDPQLSRDSFLPLLVSLDYRKSTAFKRQPLDFLPLASMAMKADNFYLMSRHAFSGTRAPRMAVIPINLRFFSKPWYLISRQANPALERYYPFKEYFQIRPMFGQERDLSGYFLARLDEARESQMGINLQACSFFLDDLQRRYLQPIPALYPHDLAMLKSNFLFRMEKDGGLLRCMLALGKFLRSVGTQAYFYVTPLPVRNIENAFPGQSKMVDENVRILVDALRAEGNWVADYHGRCQDGFFEMGFEHLNARAKRELAALIAADLAAGP